MGCGAMKLAFVTFLIAAFVEISSGATYTVGDKTGWTIPPSASFYTNWVSKLTFKVGDVLVFNFPVQAHTVAEVSKTAYDSCNTNNVISAVKSTAPANYTLSSGGTHYFICTITGHCSAGQKISIPVSATSSSPPPAAAPAPAPAASKKAPSPASTPTSAPSPSMSPSAAAATSPVPSPTKSTGGSPTPSPSPSTGGVPTPSPAPATGTTASPPSPVGPSPIPGNVPTPASEPSGASTPPPSAAPAVGGFGLLSLFSAVALALLF